MNLSQEDLLRLQAAQLAQLLLQPRVLLIHVQPQAVPHRSRPVQLDDCKNNQHEASCRPLSHTAFNALTSDLQVHGAVHGQGEGQEVEGVKASTDVAAGLTLHLRLELPVE